MIFFLFFRVDLRFSSPWRIDENFSFIYDWHLGVGFGWGHSAVVIAISTLSAKMKLHRKSFIFRPNNWVRTRRSVTLLPRLWVKVWGIDWVVIAMDEELKKKKTIVRRRNEWQIEKDEHELERVGSEQKFLRGSNLTEIPSTYRFIAFFSVCKSYISFVFALALFVSMEDERRTDTTRTTFEWEIGFSNEVLQSEEIPRQKKSTRFFFLPLLKAQQKKSFSEV